MMLGEELRPAAEKAQEKRRTKDLWEDLIDEMEYAGTTTLNSAVIHLVDGEERVATSDILDNVLQIPPAQQSRDLSMRLSNVMKKLGWQRDGENKITIIKGQKQVRGYFRPVKESVPPIHIIDKGEDTPVADNFKAHGFKEVSHQEFVNTKQYEKMGDLAPTVQTNSVLTKENGPPKLPPELLALIKSGPGGGISKDPLDYPARRGRHYDYRARRRVPCRRSTG
jgi:hypothetical protein